jgi:hypothetical protein
MRQGLRSNPVVLNTGRRRFCRSDADAVLDRVDLITDGRNWLDGYCHKVLRDFCKFRCRIDIKMPLDPIPSRLPSYPTEDDQESSQVNKIMKYVALRDDIMKCFQIIFPVFLRLGWINLGTTGCIGYQYLERSIEKLKRIYLSKGGVLLPSCSRATLMATGLFDASGNDSSNNALSKRLNSAR